MVLLREHSSASCCSTMSASPTSNKSQQEENGIQEEQTTRMKKEVKFSRSCTVRMIPCLEDYTEDDLFRLWIDPISFEVIRKRCYKDIEKMRLGVPEDDTEHCYRGLEWKLPSELKTKKLRRKRAAVGVFLEQDRQWETETNEPERISILYEALARPSREEAFRRAIEDAKQVATIDRHDYAKSVNSLSPTVSRIRRPSKCESKF